MFLSRRHRGIGFPINRIPDCTNVVDVAVEENDGISRVIVRQVHEK